MIDIFSVELAYAYLKNRQRQTIFSILGVAVGVAFFIAIYAMMQGMHLYFTEKAINVNPHVIIKDEFRTSRLQPVEILYPDAAQIIQGIKPRDDLRGIRTAQKIINGLQEMQGLTYSPVYIGQAFIHYGGKSQSTNMVGIEPDRERNISQIEKDIIIGNLDRLHTTSNGLILGELLARKLGISLNAKVSVVSPLGVQLNMKVVGIFSTGITELDNFTSYALLKKVQILQNQPNRVNQIRLKLDNLDQAEDIARDIEEKYGYRTESWKEMNKNIFDIFVIQDAIMYTTVLAILIVSGFGIFNIISTSVTEKRHDIAILKSMGFARHDIEGIFLIQGIIIGIIGAAFGWLFGYVLVEILANIKFKIEGQSFMRLEGFILYRSVWTYVIAALLAIASTAISAVLPARKAAALNPVDIIRGSV